MILVVSKHHRPTEDVIIYLRIESTVALLRDQINARKRKALHPLWNPFQQPQHDLLRQVAHAKLTKHPATIPTRRYTHSYIPRTTEYRQSRDSAPIAINHSLGKIPARIKLSHVESNRINLRWFFALCLRSQLRIDQYVLFTIYSFIHNYKAGIELALDQTLWYRVILLQ